ncbi:SsrA-binding protein [Helicobacter cetorum]|uniref:SsrA-binding protein n=1 Tax=Helicobacter cetorum TaxID=138563 RepID=UPI000CF07F4E|nr:SsrA-binding protein [Helicobacter cetorum]
MKLIANNKKAYFDYEILETLEAGIVLLGSEVKALRQSRVNLKDNFVKIVKREAFLFGVHISHLDTIHAHYRPNERRERKLLLHKKQLLKWQSEVSKERLSIVGLKLYFNERNRAKIQIALVKGKKLHDKRQSLKEKALNKEVLASLKHHFKG